VFAALIPALSPQGDRAIVQPLSAAIPRRAAREHRAYLIRVRSCGRR
jgi:hypothetical protein